VVRGKRGQDLNEELTKPEVFQKAIGLNYSFSGDRLGMHILLMDDVKSYNGIKILNLLFNEIYCLNTSNLFSIFNINMTPQKERFEATAILLAFIKVREPLQPTHASLRGLLPG
jgi:hypothetical protein